MVDIPVPPKIWLCFDFKHYLLCYLTECIGLKSEKKQHLQQDYFETSDCSKFLILQRIITK